MQIRFDWKQFFFSVADPCFGPRIRSHIFLKRSNSDLLFSDCGCEVEVKDTDPVRLKTGGFSVTECGTVARCTNPLFHGKKNNMCIDIVCIDS